MPKSAEYQLPLRITLLQPPPGVRFSLQGRGPEPVDPVVANEDDLSFSLTIRAQPEGNDAVRFLGPFTQGPPAARFVYVCSGTSAGQRDSCWTRRAKVPLSGITWSMVEQVRSLANAKLEGRFAGTSKDGGPACATVRLAGAGWQLIQD